MVPNPHPVQPEVCRAMHSVRVYERSRQRGDRETDRQGERERGTERERERRRTCRAIHSIKVYVDELSLGFGRHFEGLAVPPDIEGQKACSAQGLFRFV